MFEFACLRKHLLHYLSPQNTHSQSGAEKSLLQFCLIITEPFSPIYLKEMKNYQSLSVSRTVSQLIMRVRKPTVAYKLALQEKPKGASWRIVIKTVNNLTRSN